MFFRRTMKSFISTSGVSYIIVGLGNPGKKYEQTRHNAGFIAIDQFAKKNNVSIDRIKFRSMTGIVSIGDQKVLLMKPQTYMNLSGQAVQEAMAFYKVPPEKVLVIFDDISLDLGVIRIKRKGSHGGQNGMKNIIQCTGSQEFPRIKVGIGNKPHPDYDLADWVISQLSSHDLEKMYDGVENVVDAIPLIINGNIDEAMSKYSH